MSSKDQKQNSFLIIKLAGIGDIAFACKAINETLKNITSSLKIHWLIEKNYIDLAKSLLDTPKNIQFKFYHVNTKELFQGTPLLKAKESVKIAKYITQIKPKIILLLHRDWRYLALIRPLFIGPIVKIKTQPIHEVDLYKIAIQRVLNKLEVKQSSLPTKDSANLKNENTQSTQDKNNLKIGIVVGGAKGTKINYYEKKWPKLKNLISEILEKTSHTVFLYGTKEDEKEIEDLLKKYNLNQYKDRLINECGKYELSELKNEFKKLDRFISIDTGLIHIATLAMTKNNQKIIGLYGPTNPKIWGPQNSGQAQVEIIYKFKSCSPCYLDDGKFVPCKFTGEQFQNCMKDISIEDVLKSLT
jgi:ADP-heptose:LPS heptosyltransferase